jgi:hypothetical protein
MSIQGDILFSEDLLDPADDTALQAHLNTVRMQA